MIPRHLADVNDRSVWQIKSSSDFAKSPALGQALFVLGIGVIFRFLVYV